MSKYETEIRALVVKIQDLVTRYEYEGLEELNEQLEVLCRRDLNEMMGCNITVPGTVYAAWSAYMSRVTPSDELAGFAIKGSGMVLSRKAVIGQLETWQNHCVSLKLISQATILGKEIERLSMMSEEKYDKEGPGGNPYVVGVLAHLIEKYNLNSLDGKFGTRAHLRNEQPTGRFRDGCKNEKYQDKPEVGSYLTQPTPAYYSSKHHPTIVKDQYKTKAFTNVIPAEHALRLIDDLNHLINITGDVEYCKSLSKEVERLQYIADGLITKPSDVNYAWVIHSSLMDDIEDGFDKLEKGEKDE